MPSHIIPRKGEQSFDEASVLALGALGWALADPDRAQRLLALTGLDPDSLRARLDDPALLGAVLGFLEAHEADLVGCAQALAVRPEVLVAARARIER